MGAGLGARCGQLPAALSKPTLRPSARQSTARNELRPAEPIHQYQRGLTCTCLAGRRAIPVQILDMDPAQSALLVEAAAKRTRDAGPRRFTDQHFPADASSLRHDWCVE